MIRSESISRPPTSRRKRKRGERSDDIPTAVRIPVVLPEKREAPHDLGIKSLRARKRKDELKMKQYLSPTQEEKRLVTQWIEDAKLLIDNQPRGRRWDADDINSLRQMAADGWDWERIAFALDRSPTSVRLKYLDLAAKNKTAPVSSTHESGRNNNPPTIYRVGAKKSRGAQ